MSHPLRRPGRHRYDWFEGSGLRPFLEPLSPSEREAFLSRYRAELSAAYPKQPDGAGGYCRYPRLFFRGAKVMTSGSIVCAELAKGF